jgi:diguanylate cyclase (GGDEF)-like protein/PAS domain S-box-containing protein
MEASLFSDAPQTSSQPWRQLLGRLGSSLRFGTLKARLTGGALLALGLGMAVTALSMSQVAESSILRRAEQREHIDVQQIAGLLSQRVAEVQRALSLTGAQLSPEVADDHDRLLHFLQDRPVLRAMFAGLFVAGPDGRIRVLLTNTGENRSVESIADREYFKRAVETAYPVVSEPILSRTSQAPVIVFSHPLVSEGKVWAVLNGSMSLTSRDLMGFLSETRDFDDRSQIVISDDAGRILAHPQQASLLQPIAKDARLANAASKWILAGRPLIGTAGAWTGSGDVVAMAGEPSTGWHVWRVASREELLEPLREARANAFKVACVAGVVLAGALGLFLAWQLRPLNLLERRAADLLSGNQVGEWPQGNGEIGRLSQTLRHVWAERAQIEGFNAQVMQKLNSVMSASPVGLAFIRFQRFELFSAEGCRTLGYSESQLVGQPVSLIFPGAEDFEKLSEQAHTAFESGRSYEGEWRLLDAKGAIFWARIRARPVVSGDPESGSIWSLYNIDDQVFSRRQLEHAALHDPLTGAFNRKGFAIQLTEVFYGTAAAQPASVVMLDLDHFKPINDLGGHAAGDAMLQAVARVITSQVRASDTFARLGGDEFAVLLPNCDLAQAMVVAEKIRHGVASLVLNWEGHDFSVGTSLGVASLHSSFTGVEQWLAAADAACYEAKRSGRNGVRMATAPDEIKAGPSR